MGFDLPKWLNDHETFRLLASKGFKVMEDLDSRERDSFFRAVAKKNNVDFVEDLIRNGLDTKKYDVLSSTIQSLQEDDLSIVKCLVENHGCPVNPVKQPESVSQLTPEQEQIARRAHLMFGPMFGRGGHSNAGFSAVPHMPRQDRRDSSLAYTSYCKSTPLSSAFYSRCPKVAEYLLQNGSQVGKYELMFLGMSHESALVDMLLKRNIDLNDHNAVLFRGALVPGKDKDTAGKQITMIKTLIDAGVNPNFISETGLTCGHVIMNYICGKSENMFKLCREHKEELIDLLVNTGLDINAQNNKQETILHLCPTSDLDMLDILLSRGGNPNTRRYDGRTVAFLKLEEVISRNDSFNKTLDIFIRHNANFNLQDGGNKTILTSVMSHWNDDRTKSLQQLLSVVEITLPDGRFNFDYVYRSEQNCLFPLVQSGCNSVTLISRLSEIIISDADFDKLVACVEPSLNASEISEAAYMRTTSNRLRYDPKQDFAIIPNMHSKAHPLTYLSIYAIRKQILTANGNKSLLPRARKLPLPQSLIELITLKFMEVHVLLDEFSDDSEDEEGFFGHDDYGDFPF